MATTLTSDQLSSSLDLSSKNVLLPEGVDFVVHYADRADFPTTGRLKRIYVETNTGVLWTWSGLAYAKSSASMAEHSALAAEVAANAAALVAESAARAAAITGLQDVDAALSSRIAANESSLSGIPALIAEAEGFEQFPTYSNFPASGRLNRLYLEREQGTLWRWTGSEYFPVPGEQDGGTY